MSLGVKSLVLDLDGTLLDSKPGILQSFGEAIKAVFPEVEFDLSRITVGPPLRQLCQAAFPTASEERLRLLAQAYRSHYDQKGSTQTRLFDGGLNLLVRCQARGIGLDVATNKPRAVTAAILSRLQIHHFFREIISVDSTLPPFSGKAAMINHLLALNRLDPRRTLFVGDTSEDAAAAAECGVPFVWAAYGYGALEEDSLKAAYGTIKSLAELETIL